MEPELDFLPPTDYQPGQPVQPEWRLAFDLYDQLIDPRAGGCRPVEGLDAPADLVLGAPGLVINPTMTQAEDALRAAIDQSAQDEDLLLVYYVGHGFKHRNELAKPALRHFLQVIDSSREPASSGPKYRGFDPYTIISDAVQDVGSSLAGLVLIVDACEASSASTVVGDWLTPSGEFRSAWIGSSRLQPAYDGCFTRRFTELLREGVPQARHPHGSLVTQLRAGDIASLIEGACAGQKPARNGYQDHDPAMYVAINRAADEVLTTLALEGPEGEYLTRLVAHYQPYQLQEVLRASQGHRLTFVVGNAGTGKSTLAAALRHPPATADLISVDAVAFLSLAPTADKLAEALHRQLVTIPHFKQAAEAYERAHRHAWQTLTVGEQLLFGPLQRYSQPVTLVIDGFDRLEETQRGGVWELVTRLATGEALTHVRVIGTARPSEDLPEEAFQVSLSRLDTDAAASYLTERKIDATRHEQLIRLANGSWLVLALVADYAVRDPKWVERREAAVGDFYASLLASAKQRLDWERRIRPVLAVLAAAMGDGPTLPFAVFAEAVARLSAPATRASLYEVVADIDLYGLIDRAQPGSNDERLGLFHATLKEWLIERGLDLDMTPVHLALYDAIQDIAPRGAPIREDPAHRYALAAEAEHAWLAGRREDVVRALEARELTSPSQNLGVWQGWLPRLERECGPDGPDTLITRGHIAHWIGEAGDAAGALRLFQELLPVVERVLGPDAPHTFTTRGSIARWTGATGDAAGALRLSQGLLRDQERVLGLDAPDTLWTRANVASWTGATGDDVGALRLFRELLPVKERVLGDGAPMTLTTRGSISLWTGMTGDAAGALRLFQELLPVQERVLGPDARDTLITRHNIASLTGETGDAVGALRLFQELLPDQERVLGPDAPHTFTTRANIASITGKTGDAVGALRLFQKLLRDRERVLGPDAPDTLTTRSSIAWWTGKAGNAAGALRIFQELLPDQERVLGPDAFDTLMTRNNIAACTGKTGDKTGT